MFEGNIENESCATILVDPKTFFELKTTPIKARKCPKISKLPQKLKNKKIENKSHKMKVISLYK